MIKSMQTQKKVPKNQTLQYSDSKNSKSNAAQPPHESQSTNDSTCKQASSDNSVRSKSPKN